MNNIESIKELEKFVDEFDSFLLKKYEKEVYNRLFDSGLLDEMENKEKRGAEKLEEIEEKLFKILNIISKKERFSVNQEFTVRDGSLYIYNSKRKAHLRDILKKEKSIIKEIKYKVEEKYRDRIENIFIYLWNIKEFILVDDFISVVHAEEVPEMFHFYKETSVENSDYYLLYEPEFNERSILLYPVEAECKEAVKQRYKGRTFGNTQKGKTISENRVLDFLETKENRVNKNKRIMKQMFNSHYIEKALKMTIHKIEYSNTIIYNFDEILNSNFSQVLVSSDI